MRQLETALIPQELNYDGSQLKSHFAFKNFGILGPSLIAFTGKCHVDFTHMVDLMDLRQGKTIFSHSMLHFILEFFPPELEKGVLYQRLLVTHFKETLESYDRKIILERRGNDLYDQIHKLNISIATVSPVSTLIHAGINILSHETPVPTRGLQDYTLNPEEFAREILKRFAVEWADIESASCKARAVH